MSNSFQLRFNTLLSLHKGTFRGMMNPVKTVIRTATVGIIYRKQDNGSLSHVNVNSPQAKPLGAVGKRRLKPPRQARANIVEQLCGENVSKSFVSSLSEKLEPEVKAWADINKDLTRFPA